MNIEITYYKRGFGGDFIKIQPTIYLLKCPVCDVKHEKISSHTGGGVEFCEECFWLLQKRKMALSALPECMSPLSGTKEWHELYDHVKHLRKRLGKE